MANKWLDAETYVASNMESAEVEMLNAQAADAEQRCFGILSIDLSTGWQGVAPRVTMLFNRGCQSQMTVELSPAQIARLLPSLIFEGREAVQRAKHQTNELAATDKALWRLHRCPECGIGPYGSYARTASCLQKIAAAPTMDQMYAAYDERIPAVFDELPDSLRRLLADHLDARRPEFLGRDKDSQSPTGGP